MIGIWVRLLTIPYRYLYPCALFFICIGVYSANNDMFQVGETLAIGVFGYVLLQLGFHPAPILLGFVLGPRFEENFRLALLISYGDVGIFIERPISAMFVALSVLLIAGQVYFRVRRPRSGPRKLSDPAAGGARPSTGLGALSGQKLAPAEAGMVTGFPSENATSEKASSP